jgi:predicted RND superfamily exporter protein/CRP-like cAMP-binding protein
MERIYHLIIHRPKSILLVILLLTGFFAYHARHIRLDTSVESLLPQDDPENQYYNDVRTLFGSDEVGVIGLIADDIYTPQVLQQLQRLTQEIEKVDGVTSALSLANLPDPIADVTAPPPIMPQIPATPAAAVELKQKLADRPMYVKNFVALDGRAAAINIFFAEMSNDEFMRRGIDDTIQAIVDRENATAAQEQSPVRLYYTGLPHFKVYSANAMWWDLSRFVPLMLLFIAVVLFFSFRSFRGVLLPTVTVVISLIWTLGIMVLTGSNLSLGSMALPPLVLVIGVAYSLHIVAEYYELAQPGRTGEEVVLETLRAMNAPALMAALTTVLGFFSQVVNQILSIRQMGIYSSVGIFLAFIFSILLVPALLVLMRLPTRRAETFAPGLSHGLRKVVGTVIRRRGTVIAICSGIVVLAGWQIPNIQVDSDFQSFFRPTDPIRQATDMINRHLAGSMVFNVVVDGNARDIMKKWETLRRLKDLQLAIDALPGVDKTTSFVDYCELLDRGIQEGGGGIEVSEEGELIEAPPPGTGKRTTFLENPSQLGGVMQLLAGRPKSFALVVDKEFSRTNILVRTSLSRSTDIAATVEKIKEAAAKILPPELVAHPTGSMILLTRTTGDIVSGQIQSLTLTAGVIFLLMAGLFLSLRVGVIAMIPNLFPIVVFFGLMGVSGVALNFGTNIIAAIALGLAVDDTIHIMHRLSSEVRGTDAPETALMESLATVGKPALYYSLLLFLGFLTLGLSSFVPTQQFGVLSAVTIVVGVAGELLLLPALLATTRIITLWDLLYLKLGKDPHKKIQLFAGLRPLQAKIVTLMGELKTFPRGQPIVRQGEMGNEMYVLVKGSADAFIHLNGQRQYVRKIEHGQVFGEMGLIRHHERTVDVIAAEDVEVLAVNELFLSRMQRRYPRIGAKIFLNIAKILSDRLQHSTEREATYRLLAEGRQMEQKA